MFQETNETVAIDAAPGAPPLPEEPARTEEELAADDTRRRIRLLPPEVGAVLVTVGIAGVILPGPMGMPLLLAGGLVLLPSVFGGAERWLERRFPNFHWHGMRHVDRFIDDLEKRFPPKPPCP